MDGVSISASELRHVTLAQACASVPGTAVKLEFVLKQVAVIYGVILVVVLRLNLLLLPPPPQRPPLPNTGRWCALGACQSSCASPLEVGC